MSQHLQEIQRIIDQQIAPARALGFQVQHYDNNSLTLCAPLALNSNHHGTAFGGSLFSLAAVCGWGFVLLKMRETSLDGNIVVKQSSVEYLAPVTGDLSVSCGAEPESVEQFIQRYRDTRRARLTVSGVALDEAQKTALRLSSTYTAFAQQ